SKRKQNYPAPDRIFHEYGADALRAYLINSPIVRAEPLRFSERGVKEVVRTVLIPLRNAWSFFAQYANIDGWEPRAGLAAAPPLAERPELDRWVLSVLQSLVAEVNAQMEGYYLYKVVPPVLGFIDDLTNWYIRRSRRRFWRSADDASARQDKASAYATLYEVLVTFSKVLAPVLPFISDALYQNLVVEPGADGPTSVHLCDYPEVQAACIDAALEAQVALARQVVSMGRALREQHRLKTRQPLRRVQVVHHDAAARAALETHADIIAEELNVKAVEVVADDAGLATLGFKADFKRLGRRLGKRMKEGADAIAALTRAEWDVLSAGGSVTVADEPITAEDVVVTRTPRGDVVIETAGAVTVALDTELDAGLVAEGLVREVQSRLQRLRKDSGLDVTDRIAVELATDDAELRAAIEGGQAAIAQEVLAESFQISAGSAGEHAYDVEGHPLAVTLRRI
ncbi:MAG: class I tRNA ligase family protein, partial [Myxococcales bacterium]|nr:class I tRNA ligase family protein [Myxococcales bacterium]